MKAIYVSTLLFMCFFSLVSMEPEEPEQPLKGKITFDQVRAMVKKKGKDRESEKSDVPKKKSTRKTPRVINVEGGNQADDDQVELVRSQSLTHKRSGSLNSVPDSESYPSEKLIGKEFAKKLSDRQLTAIAPHFVDREDSPPEKRKVKTDGRKIRQRTNDRDDFKREMKKAQENLRVKLEARQQSNGKLPIEEVDRHIAQLKASEAAAEGTLTKSASEPDFLLATLREIHGKTEETKSDEDN